MGGELCTDLSRILIIHRLDVSTAHEIIRFISIDVSICTRNEDVYGWKSSIKLSKEVSVSVILTN